MRLLHELGKSNGGDISRMSFGSGHTGERASILLVSPNPNNIILNEADALSNSSALRETNSLLNMWQSDSDRN